MTSVFVANQSRDPSQTTVLRNTFAREMRKRFREIRGLIRQAVYEEDVFGLREDAPIPIIQQATPGRNNFNFPRDSKKVSSFMEWLNTQVQHEVLQVTNIDQVGESIDAAWTNTYINDAYKRGVSKGRNQMIQNGFNIPTLEATGGIEVSLASAIHADRVGLLYTRTFRDLKGITDAMDTQVSRVLAEGLASGDNPRVIANKLNSVISGNGRQQLGITDTLGRVIAPGRRAEMLARTEIIRAHAQGQLQEFKNWGMEGVSVKAELVHAGDRRVCDECRQKAASGPYTLKQAENLIPVHTSCRCAFSPIESMASAQRVESRVQSGPVSRRFRREETVIARRR